MSGNPSSQQKRKQDNLVSSSCTPVKMLPELKIQTSYLDPALYLQVFGKQISVPSVLPFSLNQLKELPQNDQMIFFVDPTLKFDFMKDALEKKNSGIEFPQSCIALKSLIEETVSREFSSLQDPYWCVTEKSTSHVYASGHEQKRQAHSDGKTLPTASERILFTTLSLHQFGFSFIRNEKLVRTSSKIIFDNHEYTLSMGIHNLKMLLVPTRSGTPSFNLGTAFVKRVFPSS